MVKLIDKLPCLSTWSVHFNCVFRISEHSYGISLFEIVLDFIYKVGDNIFVSSFDYVVWIEKWLCVKYNVCKVLAINSRDAGALTG